MIRYCGVFLLGGLLSTASVIAFVGQSGRAAANTATLMAAADPAMAEKLIARGDELFRLGDAAAARLLYERAAHEGSALAETAVGRTFDPFYFETSGLLAAAADPVQAMRWYRTAAAKGDADADRRLKALGAWLQLDAPETATDATIAARYAVIMEARRAVAAERRQAAEKSRQVAEKSKKTAVVDQPDNAPAAAEQAVSEPPATQAVVEAREQIAVQLAAEDAAREAAAERAAAESAAAELAAAEQSEKQADAERAAAERAVAAERAAERRARLEAEEAAAQPAAAPTTTGQIADAEPAAGGSGVSPTSPPRIDEAAPHDQVPAETVHPAADETASLNTDQEPEGEEGDAVAALIERQGASATPGPGAQSANRPSAAPWQTTDDGVRYRIEDGPNGFFVSVYHAPLNIIPDTAEVETECREAVLEMARRVATDYGRHIRPILDERIRTTTWRNTIDIRTRCIGTTLVEYRN